MRKPVARRIRLFAITVSLMLTSCSIEHGPGPKPDPDVTGNWVGTTNGVRIRVNIATRPGMAFGFHITEVIGPGSLVILATGDSLPFNANGSVSNLERGELGFALMSPGALTTNYGHFTGKITPVLGGDQLVGLVGAIDAKTVGPFSAVLYPGTASTLSRP
jgi:hypothetical protein